VERQGAKKRDWRAAKLLFLVQDVAEGIKDSGVRDSQKDDRSKNLLLGRGEKRKEADEGYPF